MILPVSALQSGCKLRVERQRRGRSAWVRCEKGVKVNKSVRLDPLRDAQMGSPRITASWGFYRLLQIWASREHVCCAAKK